MTRDYLDIVTAIANENIDQKKYLMRIHDQCYIRRCISLEKVGSAKILWVIIDENLTWKTHIHAILKTKTRNI